MLKRIILGALLFMLIACRKEAIFKPDPFDKRLPEYSQEGRNIAGALINDDAWRSDFFTIGLSRRNPLTISSSMYGDSTTFFFNGFYPLHEGRPMIFQAVIKNFRLPDIDSLKTIAGKTFLIDSVDSYWTYDENYARSQVKGTGRISILHVEPRERISYNVGNDEYRHPYIVAGVFEISFPLPANYSITNGRFDMMVVPGREFRVSQ